MTEKRTVKREESIKEDLLKRLARAEGQVRGVRGMVEKDAYCDDILVQLAAARQALSCVQKIVLQSHIKSCVAKGIKEGDEALVEELIAVIGKL